MEQASKQAKNSAVAARHEARGVLMSLNWRSKQAHLRRECAQKSVAPAHCYSYSLHSSCSDPFIKLCHLRQLKDSSVQQPVSILAANFVYDTGLKEKRNAFLSKG
eukprot:1161850-Pelagomonas_calceolata.AAC.5